VKAGMTKAVKIAMVPVTSVSSINVYADRVVRKGELKIMGDDKIYEVLLKDER
jgi:hypothetical protein